MAFQKNRMAFVILPLTLGVGCLPVGRQGGSSRVVRPPEVGEDPVLGWVCYSANLQSCFEGSGFASAASSPDFLGRSECAANEGGTAVFGTGMDCSDAFRAGAKSAIARCILPVDGASGPTNVRPASIKYFTPDFGEGTEKDCQELLGEYQLLQ